MGKEVSDQISHESADLLRGFSTHHSDVVHGVLRGELGNLATEDVQVEVGGAFPVEGLDHLQGCAVRDEEADLVHKAPAVVKAHGELNHQLTTDRHVHDGPVPGGSGVLVHDVHVLVGVEVRDVYGLNPEFREDEVKSVRCGLCGFLLLGDIMSKSHFLTFLLFKQPPILIFSLMLQEDFLFSSKIIRNRMPKSRLQSKEYRWEVLDGLLGQGVPLTQNQIFDGYVRKGLVAKVDVGFLPSFQKDIALFKDTLVKSGKPGMLVVNRVQDGIDNRYRTYYYKEMGFSIMPILTGGMSDSEYHHLVSAINKLKGTISDETFEEVLFAIRSRVEADYQKGPVYVDYEDNRRLKGREYRPLFYRAMLEKQVLHIHYKTFRGEELEYDFHPYLLKQYNERWFAFGWSEPYGPYTSVPLDRLEMRPEVAGRYAEERPEDYMDYFKNRVGVSNNLGAERQHCIVLSFHNKEAWGRTITKPIHPSQEILVDYIEGTQKGMVRIKVVPNKEILAKILSLGDGVHIQESKDSEYLLNHMKSLIKKLAEEYLGV